MYGDSGGSAQGGGFQINMEMEEMQTIIASTLTQVGSLKFQ